MDRKRYPTQISCLAGPRHYSSEENYLMAMEGRAVGVLPSVLRSLVLCVASGVVCRCPLGLGLRSGGGDSRNMKPVKFGFEMEGGRTLESTKFSEMFCGCRCFHVNISKEKICSCLIFLSRLDAIYITLSWSVFISKIKLQMKYCSELFPGISVRELTKISLAKIFNISLKECINH